MGRKREEIPSNYVTQKQQQQQVTHASMKKPTTRQ